MTTDYLPPNHHLDKRLDERVSAIQEELSSTTQEEALARIWNESKELETLLKQHPLKIMLAANIGFGKTTATRIIGLFGKIKEIYEEPEENPVLSLYYGNMREYSERLQLHLINERQYEFLLALLESPSEALVSDRTPYEDTDIFCEALYKQKDEKGRRLMSKAAKDFCHWYIQTKKEQLERRYRLSLDPNLVVFLTGSLDTGWQRAKKRNRKMEVREDAKKGVGLTLEFYTALHQEYEHFLERLRRHYQGPILTLPQDTVEVADATNAKGQLYVVKSVKEALKLISP